LIQNHRRRRHRLYWQFLLRLFRMVMFHLHRRRLNRQRQMLLHR
jgi:hypothetical protein